MHSLVRASARLGPKWTGDIQQERSARRALQDALGARRRRRRRQRRRRPRRGRASYRRTGLIRNCTSAPQCAGALPPRVMYAKRKLPFFGRVPGRIFRNGEQSSSKTDTLSPPSFLGAHDTRECMLFTYFTSYTRTHVLGTMTPTSMHRHTHTHTRSHTFRR